MIGLVGIGFLLLAIWMIRVDKRLDRIERRLGELMEADEISLSDIAALLDKQASLQASRGNYLLAIAYSTASVHVREVNAELHEAIKFLKGEQS